MIRTKLHEVLERYPHEHMKRDPFFAFDERVAALLTSSKAARSSIEALMEHDLVHLPYPQMTVQFGRAAEGVTWVCWLQELPGSTKINAQLFFWAEGVVGMPCIADVQVDQDNVEHFRVNIRPENRLNAHADRMELIQDFGVIICVAITMAVLMTHIGGLEREVHEAPVKLNAARERKGKQAIPRYTYVHVGHVYDSAGKKVDYGKSGRTMPIHMRAGHNRNQFYGKGRELRKLIWIPPVLVNYDGETRPVVEKRVVL